MPSEAIAPPLAALPRPWPCQIVRLLKDCPGQAKPGFGGQAAVAVARSVRHSSSARLRSGAGWHAEPSLSAACHAKPNAQGDCSPPDRFGVDAADSAGHGYPLSDPGRRGRPCRRRTAHRCARARVAAPCPDGRPTFPPCEIQATLGRVEAESGPGRFLQSGLGPGRSRAGKRTRPCAGRGSHGFQPDPAAVAWSRLAAGP